MSPAPEIRIRRWREGDLSALVGVHRAAYPDIGPEEGFDDERHYRLQLEAFPEGQLLAEIGGRVVGYATSLIIQLDEDAAFYTWREITGDGTFSTHDATGDTLYGADIAVHPDCRGQGIAMRLYEGRKELLRRFNLRRMIAHGRIPGYRAYEGRMTANEYVDAVKAGRLRDPALGVHLKAGYEPKRVLLDYLGDPSSLNYCTLLELENPDYQPEKRRIAASPLPRPVRRVRVCAAQYLQRRVAGWEEFAQNVMFFVEVAEEYHCHFLLLPELFTLQLFSTMPADLDAREATRRLAALTPRYLELFTDIAARHNLYVIAGSTPVEREGRIFNVAHLFTPSGNVYTQDKLHITPDERSYFGMEPGEGLKVFDTPLGRIAIQICYDIEFPELTRLLKRRGVQVIFVPFSTDEKKAYNRVRFTARARAIENILYVVLSGNVGNLPSIRSSLINYGQSAIFTPSDFAFPLDAKLGEADPNEETVVISDLDLGSLHQQSELGSVRPLYDLRPDLYDLRSKRTIEVIRTV